MSKIDRRHFLKTGGLAVTSSAAIGAAAVSAGTVGSSEHETSQKDPSEQRGKPRIIDFRVRPPFKRFRDSFLFRPRDPNSKGSGISLNRPTYRSYEEKSIEAFIDEMDEAGIEMAVVMGRGPDRKVAGRSGSQPNEDIADLLQTYPGRFIGFGGIDGSNVKAALQEIERAHAWGFAGIAMDNGWSDPPLYDDDETLFPIYKKCDGEGMILSLTNSIAVGPDITYSNPIQVQRVARRFRNLKIVVPHNCWPWITEMLGVALSSNIYLMADYYVFVPHMMGTEELVRAAKSFLGDRLLFASGYPVRGLVESVQLVRALPFDSQDLLNRCLGENAARLLGLSN